MASPGPSPARGGPWKMTVLTHFWCPECGPCGVDEESCCSDCGADVIASGTPEAAALPPPADPPGLVALVREWRDAETAINDWGRAGDMDAMQAASDRYDELHEQLRSCPLPAPVVSAEQIALVEDIIDQVQHDQSRRMEVNNARADALRALLTAVTGKDTTP